MNNDGRSIDRNREKETEKKQSLHFTVTVQSCQNLYQATRNVLRSFLRNKITTGDIGSLKDHDAIILR